MGLCGFGQRPGAPGYASPRAGIRATEFARRLLTSKPALSSWIMPDVYANIGGADRPTQERLAAMWHRFVTRALARLSGIAKVIGVDLSPVFVAKARELSVAHENVEFQEADARSMPFFSKSHGDLQVSEAEYMISIIDRGADHLASNKRIGAELCASLKAEARRRVAGGEFFGFIGFVGFRAAKPA
jgi:SAM-dependent methyltransferase